ncbi:glycosyltransferase [Pontibacter diazotrophicus]|uniref:Glycosyltransferase n=1 Tax=Pontibacter diazotrophicus TaxID=1400979 RepID=A0A3D8LGA8_9BACT|nr:glycosyltransferase [Pontibacter diazotrophicus]RDV16435.1 glycosyltransferase [Pontibacter diazotrophicus]
MKYWLLTTEFPPFYGGGISTYNFYTAKMLTQKGHQVSVFVNDQTVKDIVVSYSGGARIIRFNPVSTNSTAFLGHTTSLSYEFAHIIRKFVEREGKPDVIEAQEYLGIAYYLLQYKYLKYDWCKDIFMLITMHSPAYLYLEYNHVPLFQYPNYWIGEMERFCIQAADIVISPSQYLIDEVRKRAEFSHTNFYVIPNPFEFQIDTQTLEAPAIQEEIVFFGKLSAQKGTFRLLHYFKELWDNGFADSLFLIGGQDIVYHPEGNTMGNIVRKNYKEYVDKGLLRLESQLKPADIINRLARAKIAIVPSTVDNLPYVVMEMMSLGIVVLVSKQGGQSEVVTDSVDGFVFDHDQAGSFSSQLYKILRLNSKQRAAISANAVKRIANAYNLNTIYERKIIVVKAMLERDISKKDFPFIKLSAHQGKRVTVSSKGSLSVVIPYFNMGQYIDETVESLLNSSLHPAEIIIVNDGSTVYESIVKLQQYRSDSRFRVIDITNQGLANARNTGAESAKGEYLAFLDADDKVAPTYYEKAVKVLKEYSNVQFVGAWTQYFEGSNKVWPTFSPEPPLILFHNLVNSSALVYKRSAFLAAGKNDRNMPFQGLEDYESVISLSSKGFSGVVIPETLFYYRVRKNSMIRGVSKVKKQILIDYICSKHRDFYATFATDIYSLVSANGSGTKLDNPSKDLQLNSNIPFNNQLAKELLSFIKRNKHLKHIAYRAYNILNKYSL